MRLPGRLAQLGEHQLDKLGVTGSSPVPPIEKALHEGFLVAPAGNEWSSHGKDRPCHRVRSTMERSPGCRMESVAALCSTSALHDRPQ